MKRLGGVGVVFVLLVTGSFAQQSSAASSSNDSPPVTTIRGCLQGDRGNYILIGDNSMVYVLKGVGNKLDSQLNRQVEAKGELLPGTIKTGVRPEKLGSSPTDTVHGVDGVPLQIAHLPGDVRTISKHCQAADHR